MKNNEIHSEEWFTDTREYWWNDDYLELLINRLDLKNVSSIADIGCGKGLMTRKIIPFLPNLKNSFGIDIEKSHVEAAYNIINNTYKNINSKFLLGDAKKVPLESEISDFTFCQTLLIHVDEPLKVISEMKRITKNNGTVMAIETNNIINSLVKSSYLNKNITYDNIIDISKTLNLLEYDLIIQKGIYNLGEGYLSVGDYVPRLFKEAGLKNISVSVLDKACSLIPPYNTKEKQAIANELLGWINNSTAEFDYKQMKKYYIAGGGKIDKFDYLWNIQKKEALNIRKALLNETYVMPGGALMYIVSGKK